MIATKSGPLVRRSRAKVPEHLIYEIIDGQPIHYRDYREVMAGKKVAKGFTGSICLRSTIYSYVLMHLLENIDQYKLRILAHELGLYLDKSNCLTGGIFVFENEILPIEKIDEYYADVPPKVAIEIDIKADPSDIQPDDYIFKKTKKLLDFGVNKVIWIITQAKKVTTATPNAPWNTVDWHEDIEVMEGFVCNIGQYLTKRGSAFA